MQLKDLYFRDITKSDHNFIESSWLRSTISNLEKWDIPTDIWKLEYPELIKSTLIRSVVKVGVSREDPDHIYSYLIGEGVRIHFVYAKHAVRRTGIATKMIENYVQDYFGGKLETIIITHRPFFWKKVKNLDEFKKFRYNPFIFMKGNY